MTSSPLTDRDLAELAARGIEREAALAQLRLYREPPAPARLERACRPRDGIRVLGEQKAQLYATLYDGAVASLSVAKFVPASGAASRMFRALSSVVEAGGPASRREWTRRADGGDRDAAAVCVFLDGLREFAFFQALADELARSGRDLQQTAEHDVPSLLAALLSTPGLGYASLPKALLAFHNEGGEIRTAFEEHLIEAAAYARGRGDLCRLHFTVSPEHESRFRALLEEVRPRYEERFGVRYEVAFSWQKPSTDTIAVDLDGAPFRTGDGRLLLRPSGHGALIENLAEVDADLVFVKNIDNVTVDAWQGTTVLWKRALAGVLVELREEAFAHRRALALGGEAAVWAAMGFLGEQFGLEGQTNASIERLAEQAADRLDRPIRVCGMVASDTNPGGGPFWVRGRDGVVTAQIVETSQVDLADDGQRRILDGAEHFNPVDLVCTLRDWKGRAFDLARFVDREAVFIAEKSQDGRPLRSLERPGLWNGAMAGWNTVFVEVPAATFQPVKTVNDLLAPAHQGRRD